MAYYIWKSHKLSFDSYRLLELLSVQRGCFFLDSSLKKPALGRYSILGAEPFYIFRSNQTNPFAKLRELLSQFQISAAGRTLPFLGGAVGYLSYDLGLSLEEKLKPSPKSGLDIPECLFAFYNKAIIIDHARKKVHLLAVGFPEKKHYLAKSLCESNLKKLYKVLGQLKGNLDCPTRGKNELAPAQLRSNFSRPDYLLAVKKAKDYIKKGDIYQVNLSQRFQASTNASALELYQRLRQISPACFSAYFDGEGFQILSSSPERFLHLENDIVTTRPMKGTRPRGINRRQDEVLLRDLVKSAKDKAELTMIVDLMRNDLGRVCDYKTITVNPLRQMERYNTVFQTTATIRGRLYQDKDRFDLLRAAFPGGSITGCPKIRAMQIIEELEPSRRSIYTGCLGYLSFHGQMDFNMLIRTILKQGNKLYFGVGGGIVADSVPEDEYQETLVKAKAMIYALRGHPLL